MTNFFKKLFADEPQTEGRRLLAEFRQSWDEATRVGPTPYCLGSCGMVRALTGKSTKEEMGHIARCPSCKDTVARSARKFNHPRHRWARFLARMRHRYF